MKRALSFAAAAIALTGLVAAGPAAQQQPKDVNFNLELALGEEGNVSGEGAGLNPWNFVEGDDYHCEDTQYEACEVILVKVTNEFQEENAKKGRERATLDLGIYSSVPAEIQDFALRVWESSEAGEQGEPIGYADGTAGEVNGGEYNEQMTVVVTTDAEVSVRWYRVEVIYWAAAGDWRLDASFTQ